jgi:hypothetical protein
LVLNAVDRESKRKSARTRALYFLFFSLSFNAFFIHGMHVPHRFPAWHIFLTCDTVVQELSSMHFLSSVSVTALQMQMYISPPCSGK